MASIDRPPAEGNLGTVVVRTRHAPDRPPPGPARLGFPFRGFPEALHDDYRAGFLKPIDLAVVLEMIRWGSIRGRRDSCWTTRKVIAAAIDRDPRTVQSSWARLEDRGWIERLTFDGPGHVDPDDPANYTGSRIYFNWAPGRRRGDLDPAQPPPPRRKRGRRRKGAGSAPEEFISPPREMNFEAPTGPHPGASVSPPPEKSVSPKGGDPIPKEDEETLNVAAHAVAGDGGRPGAAIEQSTNSEVSPAAAWRDAELAEELVRRVRAGGVNLRVELDPERGEVILPVKLSASARELPPEVVGRLKQLRPHVLAYLKGGTPPVAATFDGLALGGKPAPKVQGPARVRDLIGSLARDPDPTIEATACRAIAEALRDHKPESSAFFLGLVSDVRRGELAEDCLQWAFEVACGRRIRNRGAAFVAAVKRWLSSHGRGSPADRAGTARGADRAG